MIDLERKFADALTAFSQSGNRWEGVTHLTYWGAARGMSADDVIAAAHGHDSTYPYILQIYELAY